MADNKKSFLLYCDLIHTIEKLPDKEAGELFKIILSYVNDKNPLIEDLLLQVTFEPIKQQLKRDLKKYENICERNKINGSLGGRPINPKKPKEPIGLSGNPKNPKKPDTDTDTDKEIDKRKKRFKNEIFDTLNKNRKKYISFKTDIEEYFNYWTEHGINDKKMRFEKEKSFGIDRRLDTWFKNKEKFNKNNKSEDQEIYLDKMKYK